MRIVCISDTHNQLNRIKVPDGDVLVHAGDATMMGKFAEVCRFVDDLKALPHKHKVVIAGNHDWLFEGYNRSKGEALLKMDSTVTYLHDTETVIDGVKFYGAPWQPWFCDWAFNLPRGGEALRGKWAGIPDDTNVLITHGPPKGILDLVPRGEQTGCEHLRARVEQLKQLKAHIFGHIHCGYGTAQPADVQFVNACICTEEYSPTNEPIVIDL